MPVKDESMALVRISIPQKQAEKMHALVECGDYPSDAEVYRDAVREFLERRKVHTTTAMEECSCPIG